MCPKSLSREILPAWMLLVVGVRFCIDVETHAMRAIGRRPRRCGNNVLTLHLRSAPTMADASMADGQATSSFLQISRREGQGHMEVVLLIAEPSTPKRGC